MTIGMLIESLAGKSAAIHGCHYDASPFTFEKDQQATSQLGKCTETKGE